MTREQVGEIFWNPSHPMNEQLKERFGYTDESLGGLKVYSPSFSEMREQLEILMAESRSAKRQMFLDNEDIWS